MSPTFDSKQVAECRAKVLDARAEISARHFWQAVDAEAQTLTAIADPHQRKSRAVARVVSQRPDLHSAYLADFNARRMDRR